jgi:hypothetical protein
MHVSDDELALCVRRLRDADLESHVEGCAACKNRLSGTARFLRDLATLSRRQRTADEPDKRREPRIPTNDIASMRVLNPLFSGREQVRLLDVSRNGLKIYVATLIEPGSLVQLRMQNIHVLGEVRYCVKAEEDGFNVGILIQDTQ